MWINVRLFTFRCERAAVGERAVVFGRPVLRAAERRLAAAASVAADGGGAADVDLLQHPADRQRHTHSGPSLCV